MYLFGFVSNKRSMHIKQSTNFKYDMKIYKYSAKDMNKYQQAFLRSEDIWWENVLWT